MRVRDPCAEGGTIAEVIDDDVRAIVEVDRDVADPVANQQGDRVLEEGPASQRKHRFRPIQRQRSQPGALAGREHKRVHLAPTRIGWDPARRTEPVTNRAASSKPGRMARQPVGSSCSGGRSRVRPLSTRIDGAARTSSRLQVVRMVPDHERVGRVDPEPGSRADQESRGRLPAPAAFIRTMWTKQNRPNGPAMPFDLGDHPQVDEVHGIAGDDPSIHDRLVGDYDHRKAGSGEQGETVQRAGQELEV